MNFETFNISSSVNNVLVSVVVLQTLKDCQKKVRYSECISISAGSGSGLNPGRPKVKVHRVCIWDGNQLMIFIGLFRRLLNINTACFKTMEKWIHSECFIAIKPILASYTNDQTLYTPTNLHHETPARSFICIIVPDDCLCSQISRASLKSQTSSTSCSLVYY